MNSTYISVIIPTYNRSKIIEKVLVALRNQDYPFPYEVIVADDGSTDDTYEVIKSLNLTLATYIKLEKGGSARARNEGIKKAKGEIIVFIDSDLIVVPSFLREHLKFHQYYNKVIVRGPVIHTYNLQNPFSTSKKITDISRAFFATGNTSVEKKYLIQAGLFDEDFTVYGWEDLELGLRLKKLGLRVVENPHAIGYHYQKKFTLSDFPMREQREKNRAIGAIIFCKKYPTLEVRWMTQNLPIFFLLERLCSIKFFLLSFLLPSKEKIVSFLLRHKKELLLTLFTNLYFYLLYLRYLREGREK